MAQRWFRKIIKLLNLFTTIFDFSNQDHLIPGGYLLCWTIASIYHMGCW